MRIYALIGRIGAGKTTFAKELVTWTGARYFSTSGFLRTEHPNLSRAELQVMGDKIDVFTKGAWIRQELWKLEPTWKKPVVVDCVRTAQQIAHLRDAWGKDCLVVGITSRDLNDHIRRREYNIEQMQELLQALQHPVEQNLPVWEADLTFDNTRFDSQSLIQIAHFASNGGLKASRKEQAI